MRFIFYYVFLRWFARILFCAQQDPIERLYVSIEGDFSNLLDAADEGVEKTKDKLGELDKEGQKAGGGITKGAALAGAAFGLAAAGASKLLDVIINIASSAVQMFKNLANEAVQLASDFEQVEMTFTNIFGSRNEAQKFLSDLRGEASKLGISFNDAAQFAKSIYPDTKNAEEFNRILKNAAIGAADAGLPLRELIFSFNEAVAGDFTSIRDRLDIPREVIERIKASPDIVAALNEELEKLFAKRGVDNLEAMSSTFDGLKRQIAGFREGLLGVAGAQILTPLREGLQTIVDIIKEYGPAFNYVAEQIGEVVALLIDFARDEVIGKAFDPVAVFHLVESLKEGVEWLRGTTEAFLDSLRAAKAFGEQTLPLLSLIGQGITANLSITWELVKNFTGLGIVITALSRRVEEAGGFFQALQAAFIAGAQGVAIIKAAITQLTFIVDGAWEALSGLANLLVAIATGNVDAIKDAMLRFNNGIKEATTDGIDAFNKSMLESAKAIDEATAKTEKDTKAVKDNTKAKEDNADVPPPEEPLLDQSKIDSYTDQLIKATERRDEQLADLEQDHGQRMADIIKAANDKGLAIEEKYSDDLAKLAKETEEKRLDIIEKTRRELADLAKSTDQELKTKRKQFNTDERRETEDHLKEMRRLQEDHLLSLEEAVRDRDAGVIVDLQRRFQTETARKEEDFQQGQNRDKSDFNDELKQIRENEAQRRQEILDKQAEQFADLQKHEQDKRLELDMRRQEENEKLQQNLQEQLLREQENYAQRKQALDEALQQQLEAIAEGLSKEKDITEEGAREILEKFDEYFGIGGDIDQLMADFARRRKIRADITVAFGGVTTTEPTAEPTTQTRLGAGLSAKPGGKRLGGVQEFATGGTLLADKPTLALFGEKGPEVVQFTPMSQLSSPGSREPGRMIIEMTGSAPPGIGTSEVDRIAGVLLSAIRETGVLG